MSITQKGKMNMNKNTNLMWQESSCQVYQITIVVLPSEDGTTMNHDVAGGAGCKNTGDNIKVAPPLTCLYMSAYLKREGFQVQLIDVNARRSNEKEIRMTDEKELFILYGSLPTIKTDVKYISQMRERNENAKIIYVNAVAGNFKHELKEVKLNGIIAGDAELSIVEAVYKCLETNQVTYYEEYFTEENIDNGLYPDWECANMDYYTSFSVKASRGCSLGCPHCPYYAYQNEKIVARNVTDVIEEIKYLYDTYQIEYFLFRDPCFTYNMNRAKELVEGIKKLNLPIEWGCETRIEYLNEELIHKMKEAGCHNIRMGVEAANKEILKNAGRLNVLKDADSYLAKAKEIVELCKKEKLYTIQFYMVGFPEETVDTMQELKEYVDECDPDIALVNFIVPYPNTKYRQKLEELDLIRVFDYTLYGSKDIPVSDTLELNLNQLKEEKDKLEKYFKERNRQFYPIR